MRTYTLTFLKSVRIVYFVLALLILPGTTYRASAQYDLDYVSYRDFYETLAPYGQWLEDAKLGYVWLPAVDINFRPYYTNGHWQMTNYGNTWISDYPWGWACFHYGRWTYDDYYGWLWVPGNHWGPAWVSWRHADGYYGWAPLSPGFEAGQPITAYKCPSDWWIFIPARYLYSGNYYRFWYGPRDNGKLVKAGNIITNTSTWEKTVHITGPTISHVKQTTGVAPEVYHVRGSRNHNTRFQADEIRMFKPDEIPTSWDGRKAVPPKAIQAPRSIGSPQKITENSGSVPPFREEVISRNNSGEFVVGTNITPTAEPEKNTRTSKNPYEWDVNRSVKQEYVPPPKPKPTPPVKNTKPTTRRKSSTNRTTAPNTTVAPATAQPATTR
jgi:hypothetical protein